MSDKKEKNAINLTDNYEGIVEENDESSEESSTE